MVGIKALKFYLIALISLISLSASAETELNASVDRSKIYEMDTLNLTVQGQVDMDFSFGGLMNFGLGQTESPDTSELEKDFDVLDRQQSYNMQSINGDSKAQILWRYSLAPKNVGVLEIPALKYKDAETKPITITVIEGKAPKNSSEPPAIFLEAETDKKEAYVQEQIIYTLRLYSQGLVNGELSEPSSNDAIIEPFGEQKKYYKMAFNQRYEVIERQYLIYPQKSGQLTIDKQTFQGVSLKHGRRTRMKDISDAVELSIKPPSSDFSGKNWLPATSLFLNEEWQGDLDNLKVGDSITRKIELSALGLLGSALPPITMPESPLYKLYTDKPETESIAHDSGAQAKRVDSFAIVAIKPGEIQLDEIRIPWWDTVNNVERVAVIPAQKLTIAANPDLPVSSQKPAEPEKKLDTSSAQSHEELNQQQPMPIAEIPSVSTSNHLWQTISAILFILWISSSIYLARKLKTLNAKLDAIPTPKQQLQTGEKILFNRLINHIKNDDNAMSQSALNWFGFIQTEIDPTFKIASLNDIKDLEPAIFEQLKAYEEKHYSPNASLDYDKNKLIELFKGLRKKYQEAINKDKRMSNKGALLESFYQ